ncbi:DUF1963 domain-containing protein [Falsiroseomonas sp. HW251]|uniref:DUF1963 domain-containing protein n=1 Tax=Falsiroseomonas sp. HW251 TaxID=3390998 RepID=UPI003D3156C9
MGWLDRLIGRRAGAADNVALERLRDLSQHHQQLHHRDPETEVHEDRLSVRLRPIVPLPRGRQRRSWFGGYPRLPGSVNWPMSDGAPMRFLAQIDLGELPTGLWGGIGPRSGWIGIFIGTRDGRPAATVLQLRTLAAERISPPLWRAEHMTRLPFNDAPEGFVLDPPDWPVEVIVQPADAPDLHRPRRARFEDPDHLPFYGQVMPDIGRALYQPHDWATLKLLIAVLRNQAQHRRDQAVGVLGRAAPRKEADDLAGPEVILAEADEAARRFADLDPDLPWNEETWRPFSVLAATWRKRLHRRALDGNEPLASLASRVANYAEGLMRCAEREDRTDRDAFRKLAALRDPCFDLWREIRGDARLPQGTVAGQPNREGFRRFRAQQPAIWDGYAQRLHELHAALSELQVELGVQGGIATDTWFGTVFGQGMPPTREEGAKLVTVWLRTAQLLAREAGGGNQADAASTVARTELVRADSEDSRLAALAEQAAATEAAGTAFSWAVWQPRIEALRPSSDAAWRSVLMAWQQLRAFQLGRAYARGEPLPDVLRTHMLARWAFDARYEIGRMGGPPSTKAYNGRGEEDRLLLLEMPTSTLFGWGFGDEGSLALTIRRDELRRGDFSKVAAGIMA